MNLKNCPRCGKLFADNDGIHKLCPVCRNHEEDYFQKVKDYLWDHPKATIEEVYEETKVEREMIIKFVKEDRLIAEGLDIDFLLECERCGTPISHGRFCERCQQELIDGFSNKPSKKDKSREKDQLKAQKMHLADRLRKGNR